MTDKKKLTINAGCPVVDNQNGLTTSPRGPQLMQDVWFLLQDFYYQEGHEVLFFSS